MRKTKRISPATTASSMHTSRSTTAILNADESRLFGCIYIDPAERAGADADISWWVVDDAVGSNLDTTLVEIRPRVVSRWPGRSRDPGSSAATSRGPNGSHFPSSRHPRRI